MHREENSIFFKEFNEPVLFINKTHFNKIYLGLSVLFDLKMGMKVLNDEFSIDIYFKLLFFFFEKAPFDFWFLLHSNVNVILSQKNERSD